MVETINMEGTIKSIKETTSRKADSEEEIISVMSISTNRGTVTLKADPEVMEGFNPKDKVSIKLLRTQMTLKEMAKPKINK